MQTMTSPVSLLGVAVLVTFSIAATAQFTPFPSNSPVANYGTGSPGTGGVSPSLTTNGLPRVGNLVFRIVGEDIVGGAPGLLLFSPVGTDSLVPGLGQFYVYSPALLAVPFNANGSPGAPGARAEGAPCSNLPGCAHDPHPSRSHT